MVTGALTLTFWNGAAVRFEEGEGAERDPVAMLIEEVVERAGLTLTKEQRTAILKILRELVYRDVRAIQELLRFIPGTESQGDESWDFD
jgi:hypothetical protein